MRFFVPRPLWNQVNTASVVQSKLNEPHITLTGIPLSIAAERVANEVSRLHPLVNNNTTFLLDPSIPSAPCTRGLHLFSLPSFSPDDLSALRVALNCALEVYIEPDLDEVEAALDKIWASFS